MKFFSSLAAWLLLACAVAATEQAALTGTRTFQSPAANVAQQRYAETLKRARTAYAAELEGAVKLALAARSLEEANAFNELKKVLEAGGMPPMPGAVAKIGAANDARARFEKAVAATQKQYGADLQPALKAAMAGGLLEESNAINSELKALSIVAVAPAPSPGAGKPTGPAKPVGPGLMMTRYPMHPTQKDGNRGAGYVLYSDLGKPLAAPRNVKTLKWTKEIPENAVVAGYLRIDVPGTYDFNSRSGWDRNELLIDGNIVCGFRDGEEKICTLELAAGLHPIISVGYAHATDEVRVKWKPPGGKELVEIPPTLLSH